MTTPLARVVAASLATGAVGALAATLLVVPGAAEHTTTGAALLAFAAGWSALALLSTRLTAEPQRWAWLPAVLMGATGLGQLVAAPGDDALTAAGWVWPPALLALTTWCVTRVRVAMTSRRGRWLVHALLGALALASVGGAVETLALAHDPTMPGERYDVGGRQLHLHCTGTGSPTVVLVSGTSESAASWDRVQPGVAATTRVCAYDRAGQGWSDDAPHPQDGAEMARDLHRLLAAAGEQGPYVLAGHSLGGVYSMVFAAHYPADVAGLVLLDSTTPEQFTALPKYAGQYQLIRRLYGVTPSLARLGIGRPFGVTSRALENAHDDVSRYRVAMRQAGALTDLGGKPLVVVTAAGTLRDTPGWRAAQDKLSGLSTRTRHVVAPTTHAGLLADARGAAASTAAVVDVVRSAEEPVGVRDSTVAR